MEIIEYSHDIPIRPNRGPLSRLRGFMQRKKLSRAGKAHAEDLVERELLEQLEGERYLEQLERRINMADGEISGLTSRGRFTRLESRTRRSSRTGTKGTITSNLWFGGITGPTGICSL